VSGAGGREGGGAPGTDDGRAPEQEARKHVLITSIQEVIGLVEGVGSWGRRSSVWPLSSGLACCAIEMVVAAASRFDIARFGMEVFRPSPRQADLMIVSGTVTKKMLPVIVRLYNQMAEPKYVLSMGACANGGGPFKEGYNVISGIDEFLPVDIYVRGCPPTPQALLHGLIELQKKIDSESFIKTWRMRRRQEIPVPLLGPDLIDRRQAGEIAEKMGRNEDQRAVSPKSLPARKPAPSAAEADALGEGSTARFAGAMLVRKFGADKVKSHAKDSLVVDRSVWLESARALRDEFGYSYLSNLAAADYSDCYEVVYNLHSLEKNGAALSVKVRADRAEPEVPSVTGIWHGADFQEREAFDLMGVRFSGHPNLKRILMWDGFEGHPLRKDYLEPYYEEPRKSYPTRWKEGVYRSAEDRNLWRRNVIYPAGMDSASLLRGEMEGAQDGDGERLMWLSLGPQHPSTHGVFQVKTLLDGERVVRLEPVMGYLHRSHDKIGERNTYIMNMPYTDRLDYFTSMANNLAYAVAVEKLTGMKVTERAEYIRVIMAELSRVLNHVMSIGFLLNDLGAMFTPVIYAFEERELILDLFEAVSGSRMMCNYMRFSGVARDLPDEFLALARKLVSDRLPRSIDMFDRYLTKNEIVRNRLEGVGVLPREAAISASVSGPVLRASGVAYDIRKVEPYSIYDRFEFSVVSRNNGDSYDRYLVRLGEMRESLRILEQALKQIPESGPIVEKNQYLLRVPEGEVYSRCENPKGELGFYIVSDGSMWPYRYHVRSPSFLNITALDRMCRGHLVADVVAILGSIDIVLGELDR